MFLNLVLFAVGARDQTPLPEDAVPVGGHAGGPARRPGHVREARAQPPEAAHSGRLRAPRARAQSRQVRRVLRAHTGAPSPF